MNHLFGNYSHQDQLWKQCWSEEQNSPEKEGTGGGWGCAVDGCDKESFGVVWADGMTA